MDNGRLDVVLVARGLVDSRNKAQQLIADGHITVNGLKAVKASTLVRETDDIAQVGDSCPYVSRGGLKLEKALRDFQVVPSGYICGDFGASTGGFTDCLLQHGAAKVYAVDVGENQLADKLRKDSRVVVMEKTNIRDLDENAFCEQLDFAVVDVSFISLRLVLPTIRQFLKRGGMILCLIKPQFEAGRENIEKRGIVRSPKTHCAVLRAFCNQSATDGLFVQKLTYSPVKGSEGNIEFLALLSDSQQGFVPDIDKIVADAHRYL